MYESMKKETEELINKNHIRVDNFLWHRRQREELNEEIFYKNSKNIGFLYWDYDSLKDGQSSSLYVVDMHIFF